MEGTVAAGELVAASESRPARGVRFEIATRAHDAAIRALLRDTPMHGQISVSIEREPNYFAAVPIEGPEHHTIVAIEDGQLIAMGRISARERFINGRPMRIGYLSGLRLRSSHHGRASIVRKGYQFFHQLHQQSGPPIYLTSIIVDNLPARRLLESGLKGMPTYRFLGDFVTLAIGRRRTTELFKPTVKARRRFREKHLRLAYGSVKIVPAIIGLLNADQQKYQFAPSWSAQDLSLPGLSPADFRLACGPDGSPVASTAIWDQQRVKQTVLRGYSPQLRRMRPILNAGAILLGRPRLPAVGQPVSSAYISHVAGDLGQPDLVEQFIRLLHGPAQTLGIDYLLAGFDARDPRLQHLRRVFRPREYLSRLYAVYWDDGAELARSLDDRLLAPELALL